MGIATSDLFLLTKAIEAVKQSKRTPLRVMCIGYPDVLLGNANYESVAAGQDWSSKLVNRPDMDVWLKRHNVRTSEITRIPTIDSFLSLFEQVEVDIFDITLRTGKEIIFDLNQKITEEMHGSYDLIIDPGSTQYIFDVATCLFNYVNLLKVGGAIYHRLPLIMLNHGFYNFQPNLFADFYQANGLDVLGMNGSLSGIDTNPKMFDLPMHQRFQLNNRNMDQTVEACLHLAAIKKQNVAPVIPVNYTYRT